MVGHLEVIRHRLKSVELQPERCTGLAVRERTAVPLQCDEVQNPRKGDEHLMAGSRSQPNRHSLDGAFEVP